MSRINIAAILARLNRAKAADRIMADLVSAAKDLPLDSGLRPASPKAKPQHCWVCGCVFRSASAICPDWNKHKFQSVKVNGGAREIPGDADDERNYIGGWQGAGRAIIRGDKVDNRDRRVVGGARSAQRMKAAKAKIAVEAAKAQALAEREAAFQAIVWPDHVTDLQRRAFYLHHVKALSFQKTGLEMGITKAVVKEHFDKAKLYA